MKKVMLIDDDPTMRTLLKTLLELDNFSVIEISPVSTETIIQSIITNHPDAIILDVHLQTLNGIDLVKKIRQYCSEIPLNVIMTSGEELKYACIEAGANHFLLKPFMPATLIELLSPPDVVV
ncbi:MAG TPA: response regulator [Anaerolineaceae bacterium]|nr:response regulator [Anaerolineaceae bacterium]HOH19516.1 response regulator [Anaerolineaceae bacterium]HPA33055.1 response regulator [Anaerolineaceae bacterium]